MKVLHARRLQNLSQGDLGVMAGISSGTISRIERGVFRNPTKKTLAALADALGLSANYLLPNLILCAVCGCNPGRFWVPRDKAFYCTDCFGCRKKGR